ncbi:hypothetical protein EVAR_73631_1 [Eumeta japonica]|uniref:Uncharacterized protein n=1 Tax=Eumeta variegata TaxID=151549 RepID=A0A4C1SY42_EUMVA|nr:hypothetical protein EVAR_73631_1 [Eumeta japonica]
MDASLEKIDRRRHIESYIQLKLKSTTVSHYHYSAINSEQNRQHTLHADKDRIRIFSGLCLGRTIFSINGHFKSKLSNQSAKCESSLTVKHILSECPAFHTQGNNIFGIHQPQTTHSSLINQKSTKFTNSSK